MHNSYAERRGDDPRTGSSDGFTIGRTMFGQKGTVLTEAPSLDAALGLAGWDYEVEKVPAFVQTETYDDEPIYGPAKGCFVVRRTDTGAALGHVGPRYSLVQNRKALSRIEPMFDAGLAWPEAGGTFRDGGTAWMILGFDREKLSEATDGMPDYLWEKESLQPYGIVLLDHTGMRSDLLLQLPYRIACLNALPGLMRNGEGAAKIRHTGDAATKFEREAGRLFNGMAHRYAKLADLVGLLRLQTLTEHAFHRLVQEIALPITPQKPDESGRQVAARQRQIERRVVVREMWTAGAGHSGDRSAWEAMNGLIEAQDHNPLFNRREVGLASQIDGSRMASKRRVFQALTRYGRDERFRDAIDDGTINLN